MKVTLAIFTLNEVEGMKAVMPKILPAGYDQLLIIDGGSTDGTIEYAKQNGYQLFIQQRPGFAAAVREAAEKTAGDVLILFSPDGNSEPEAIPKIIEKIKNGSDIVIASRYLDGAKSYDDDMVTALGNFLFTKIVNIIFRTKLTDYLVMYRGYRIDVLRKLKFDTNDVAWGSQILLRAIKSGAKIGEVSADEPKRIGGIRKMRPVYNGIQEVIMIFKEFFNRTRYL